MYSISPLRYPGGKSRLYNKIEPIILANKSKEYAEPFSGGFGLGLLLLKKNIIKKAYINDLDKNIFYFWKLITTDLEFVKKSINRVSRLNTPKQWLEERKIQKAFFNSKNFGYKKKGFATLFLNRVNHSGILAAGPIGGSKQKGIYKINCRFNKERLISQIEWIHSMKEKIRVSNKDYRDFINQLPNHVFVFLDPPYVAKGGCLYMNNFKEKDHRNLSNFLEKINHSWVMTYDNNSLIKNIYCNKKWDLELFKLKHYAGNYKVGKELLIHNANLKKN